MEGLGVAASMEAPPKMDVHGTGGLAYADNVEILLRNPSLLERQEAAAQRTRYYAEKYLIENASFKSCAHSACLSNNHYILDASRRTGFLERHTEPIHKRKSELVVLFGMATWRAVRDNEDRNLQFIVVRIPI